MKKTASRIWRSTNPWRSTCGSSVAAMKINSDLERIGVWR